MWPQCNLRNPPHFIALPSPRLTCLPLFAKHLATIARRGMFSLKPSSALADQKLPHALPRPVLRPRTTILLFVVSKLENQHPSKQKVYSSQFIINWFCLQQCDTIDLWISSSWRNVAWNSVLYFTCGIRPLRLLTRIGRASESSRLVIYWTGCVFDLLLLPPSSISSNCVKPD